jgi:NDP-sugar pyrophosphorylase family protein
MWLEHLEKQGVEEVLINTRLPHEKIEAFQGDWTGAQTKISVFQELEHLGSAGVILANKDWVAGPEPFLILHCDKPTNANIGKMISFHCQHGFPLTLGVVKTQAPVCRGAVEAEEDGTVTALAEMSWCPKSNFAAADIYVADFRIFDFFPEEKPLESGPLDLGLHVIPKMVGNMKIYCIQDFTLDAGTSSAYEAAHALWKERSDDP